MNVLVNGIGNLGTTLLYLLLEHRELLGINQIYALKRTPQPWQRQDLADLQAAGVILCSPHQNGPFQPIDPIKDTVHYIFDCTNNGGGNQSKTFYLSFPNLIGASAQGSEKGFGCSFMSGINNQRILQETFAHIVSCNTHSLACLLTTFCGSQLETLEAADFVVVRRSEDLGNHQRLVSANVVARHLDPGLGTHHSIDVKDLFATVGISCYVTSSDVTTPSQLMHGVRFNITFKGEKSEVEMRELIARSPYVATTEKFDSNVIFERGRRHGFHGRIFSHAVLISNNLLIAPKSIKGWAFIPQEGNTLLSTLHAFLLRTQPERSERILEQLQRILLRKAW